ncbi:hypothetical protein ACHAXH_009743, partial [Discostella pseudostelligera]
MARGRITLSTPVYIYHGDGVANVPLDTSHVSVDPSVTSIPDGAFKHCFHLKKIELPEGLQRIGKQAFDCCTRLATVNIPSTVIEIGQRACSECAKLKQMELPRGLQTIETGLFEGCKLLTNVTLPSELREIKANAFKGCKSLAPIDFPSSLKVIGPSSFQGMGLTKLNLPDSVEEIGTFAFTNSAFTSFRVPPLVTKFYADIISGHNSIFSLLLSENVNEIVSTGDNCDVHLDELRNVAFPTNVKLSLNDHPSDLFWALMNALSDPMSDGHEILDALTNRFYELPIHKICYYHPYRDTETVLMDLKREINPWSGTFLGKLNETGKQQDTLGMNPLHILACSTKHDMELFQLLVEKYPENLIMKDKWGDIPLLYAFWGNAPSDILQFLVESYKANYANFQIPWERIIKTIANGKASFPLIQNVLATHKQYFPDQKCNLQDLVNSMLNGFRLRAPIKTFRFIVHASISERLDSLNVKQWRKELEKNVNAINDREYARREDTMLVYNKLDLFERVKEATSMLELSLWKAAIENRLGKKVRTGYGTTYREQCRISCGAEIV